MWMCGFADFCELHGFNFVKKESITKSKIFHRFYKFDHLIATNGTLNGTFYHTYLILFFQLILIPIVSIVLFFVFVRKPKYAVPSVSAIYLQT